jgi:hypothetical protein
MLYLNIKRSGYLAERADIRRNSEKHMILIRNFITNCSESFPVASPEDRFGGAGWPVFRL